jgi:hypothetical protein
MCTCISILDHRAASAKVCTAGHCDVIGRPAEPASHCARTLRLSVPKRNQHVVVIRWDISSIATCSPILGASRYRSRPQSRLSFISSKAGKGGGGSLASRFAEEHHHGILPIKTLTKPTRHSGASNLDICWNFQVS